MWKILNVSFLCVNLNLSFPRENQLENVSVGHGIINGLESEAGGFRLGPVYISSRKTLFLLISVYLSGERGK